MIPAEVLLKLLEEKDLVPPEVLAELRAQVARSLKTPKPINAAMVARILVERGYLSRLLAQRLMLQVETEWAARNPRQKMEPLVLRPFESSAEETGENSLPPEEPIELLPVEDEAPPPLAAPGAHRPAQPPQDAATSIGTGSPSAETVLPPPTEVPGQDLWSELLLPPVPAPAPAPPAEAWAIRRRRNPWESPLILFGGGGILLLLFVGIVLIWSLNRRTGDELLASADEDYRAGAYTQAVHKYDKFLEDFPRHPQAGAARVRRGLAQLRQVFQSQAPLQVLEATKRILAEISPVPEFHAEADAELTALLPQLADNLARAALQKTDPQFVTGGREALSLCRRFIPQEKRPSAKLDEIETTLQLAERRISEKDELTKTLAHLERCVQTGQLDEAYATRKKFLEDFPQRQPIPELTAVMQRVAEAEKSRVKFVTLSPVGEKQLEQLPHRQTASFALLKKDVAPVEDDQVLLVTDQSTLFALQAKSGRLLWQYPVAELALPALPQDTWPILSVEGRSVVFVPDRMTSAIRGIDLTTGEVRERILLPDRPHSWPLIQEKAALILGESGRICWIDLTRRETLRELTLPQKAAFLPGVKSGKWYVLGEHSNLFEIDPGVGHCSRVWYLGHEVGEVSVPPALLADYMFLCTRGAANQAQMRVVSLVTPDSEKPADVYVQVLPLPAVVETPLQTQGNRLALITRDGHLMVYQLRAGPSREPLGLLAEGKSPGTAAEGDKFVNRWIVFRGEFLFTADSAVAQFELQASAARLVPRWVACENTLAVGPPAVVDSVVFYAYRRRQNTGLFVTALDATNGKSYWEVHLGDAPLGSVQQGSETPALVAITMGGHVVRWSTEEPSAFHRSVESSLGSMPVEVPEISPQPLVCSPTGQVWVVGYPGSPEVTVIDARSEPPERRKLTFTRPVTGPVVAFGDGFVIGLTQGTLVWLGLDPSRPQSVVYQAPIVPGEDVRYTGAVVLSGDTILVCDSRGHLSKLHFLKDSSGLVLEFDTALDAPVVSSLAKTGNMIVGVDAKDRLLVIDEQSLKPTAVFPLSARCLWGPVGAGNLASLYTADGTLWWVTRSREVHRVSLPQRLPVGDPVFVEGKLVFAAATGELVSIDPAAEKVVHSVALRSRFTTGVNLIKEQFVVGTLDGRWLHVPRGLVMSDGSQK